MPVFAHSLLHSFGWMMCHLRLEKKQTKKHPHSEWVICRNSVFFTSFCVNNSISAWMCALLHCAVISSVVFTDKLIIQLSNCSFSQVSIYIFFFFLNIIRNTTKHSSLLFLILNLWSSRATGPAQPRHVVFFSLPTEMSLETTFNVK